MAGKEPRDKERMMVDWIQGTGRSAGRSMALVALLATAVTPAAGQEAPPMTPQILFFLDEVQGQPGEAVDMALSVETNVSIAAISFAINFDEQSLFLESAERVLLPANPPAAAGERSTADLDNRDEMAGDQLEEGWVRIDLAASETTRDLGLPLGTRVPIFRLGFRIRPTAASGFAAVGFDDIGPLRFADQFVILTNAVEVKDGAAPLGAYQMAEEDLVDGGVIIKIIGEVGFFLRGDANGDLMRDISDPVRTLLVLFNGQGYFLCEDAADANDDGRIDVTDPIFSLDCLFSLSRSFPPPNRWGPDPTEDDPLDCDES